MWPSNVFFVYGPCCVTMVGPTAASFGSSWWMLCHRQLAFVADAVANVPLSADALLLLVSSLTDSLLPTSFGLRRCFAVEIASLWQMLCHNMVVVWGSTPADALPSMFVCLCRLLRVDALPPWF
jgi:hypothetical protein